MHNLRYGDVLPPEYWLRGGNLAGQAGADSGGNFTLDLNWAYLPHRAATVTRHGDGTSEFSAVYTAQVPDVLFLPVIRRQN